MRIESRIGELIGLTEEGTADRLRALLERCGLDRPVEEKHAVEALLDAARSDKKVRRGMMRCVLLSRIGQVARAADGSFSHEIPPDRAAELLRSALRSEGGE
jgi:3-dehydroquinate synthetase